MNKFQLALCCLLLFCGCLKKEKPPTACFSVPDEVYMDEPAVFTSCSENDEQRLWDFGDSSYSDAKYPEHAFSNAGIYTVVLRTENDDGVDVQTRNVSVLRYQLKSAELKKLSYPAQWDCHWMHLYIDNQHAARTKYPCQYGLFQIFTVDINGNLCNRVSVTPVTELEFRWLDNGKWKNHKLAMDGNIDLKKNLTHTDVLFTGNGVTATLDLNFTTSTEPLPKNTCQ